MPGPSISVFNTCQFPLRVSVNQGAPFVMPGASAVASMSPQLPSTGGPAWGRMPGPNTFAPGSNYVSVAPEGMNPATLNVDVPGSRPWNSIQLYLFIDQGGDARWVLLDAGQFVSGSLR